MGQELLVETRCEGSTQELLEVLTSVWTNGSSVGANASSTECLGVLASASVLGKRKSLKAGNLLIKSWKEDSKKSLFVYCDFCPLLFFSFSSILCLSTWKPSPISAFRKGLVIKVLVVRNFCCLIFDLASFLEVFQEPNCSVDKL